VTLRRGLNRLFVVAWAVWILLAARWLVNESAQQRAFWIQRISEGQHGRATPAELAKFEQHYNESAVGRTVAGLFTSAAGLTILATVVFVVPALTYGLLYALRATASGVFRGFRSSH
jgi:hypothetical protein